jgi:SAM-dependent methyltransferase
MLDIARRRAAQLDPAAAGRVSFCHAPAAEIPDRFPGDHFDLVLCYTLLEYLSEPWGILGTLARVLRPGGTLSLLFANPRSEPLRWALARGDLEGARRALYGQTAGADLFGLPRRTFTVEEEQKALAGEGLNVVAWCGVRAFADYLPADKLADPGFYDRLLELEAAAGPMDPYRQVARYNLVLAVKSSSP